MSGALDNIRVLEVASYLTGPYASMLLGDFGADVIKVEAPGGDPFRGWEEHGYSSNFRSVNRNKRSITIDLKQDRGREILLRLADRADVLIQNFRPGVVGRLAIDYDSVSARNPRIVYCSISGFGEGSDEPGYDTIGQAASGLLSLMTDLTDPRPIGISLSDHVTGLFACQGILAALLSRERTGLGEHVQTSLLRAGVSFAQEAASRYFTTGVTPTRETRVRSALVFAFLASDKLPFVVHLSSPAKFWEALTDAVGLPRLRSDPRFVDRDSRIKNYPVLREVLADVFAGAPRESWLSRLRQRDVPCGPIRDMSEVFADPQVAAMGMPVCLNHPVMQQVRCSGSALEMRRTPVSYRAAPPLAGQHTDEILTELGYDLSARRTLREQHVV
ncbi:MAG: CaiB/BaiF CoA transferase family protein [Tepidisphaeraceae bacterium]